MKRRYIDSETGALVAPAVDRASVDAAERLTARSLAETRPADRWDLARVMVRRQIERMGIDVQ